MADQTLPIPGVLEAAHPPSGTLEWLHSWVVTVDHKKLGIIYICLLAVLSAGGRR